jgi:ATP-binding cassette subfamily F protein 3
LLNIYHLKKSYGASTILDGVSFILNKGERVGLIGPNGVGKSTLLRLITGAEPPDSGSISLAPGARIGALHQGLITPPGTTALEAVLSGLPGWIEAAREADHLAALIADHPDLMPDYEAAYERFETLGGYPIESRAHELITALGGGRIDPAAQVETLSGGEQTRIALAGVLLSEPDVLLLDEPTNHLDIAALEWLEGFLSQYRGAVLLISHDRVFLDHTVTRILELDERKRALAHWVGNYSAYVEQKAAAIERQFAGWKDDQEAIHKMRTDIARTKEQAQGVERSTTPRDPVVRRYAKKVAKKATSREKKLDRFIADEDRVEKPDRQWGMKLDFAPSLRGGQDVLAGRGLGHAFEGRGWLFQNVDVLLRYGDRIALLGENGAGKSTLLSILAGAIPPQAGEVKPGAGVQIGYMPQKQETLDPALNPLAVIQAAAPITATEARNFLHYFLFEGDEALRRIGDLSYGERSRLLLARLVISGANCLILDEPLNHLDIPARERFEEALMAFPGAVLVAAHDRAFIDRFASGIWSLEGGSLRQVVDRAALSRSV